MKKYIRRFVIGAFLTSAMLAASYPVAKDVIIKRNKKLENFPAYTSIDEARRDLRKEKALIGLGDYDNVDVKFDDDYPSAYSTSSSIYIIHRDASGGKILESQSLIVLGGFRNRKTIQHELYHIKTSIEGSPFGMFRNWYPFNIIEEWQATSYALEDE